MQTKSLADKLNDGGERLTWKRQRIEFIIKLVNNFLCENKSLWVSCPKVSHSGQLSFETPQCRWVLREKGEQYQIKCFVCDPDDSNGQVLHHCGLEYNPNTGHIRMGAADISEVYQAREILVKGILEEFHAGTAWAPFFDAGNE